MNKKASSEPSGYEETFIKFILLFIQALRR